MRTSSQSAAATPVHAAPSPADVLPPVRQCAQGTRKSVTARALLTMDARCARSRDTRLYVCCAKDVRASGVLSGCTH